MADSRQPSLILVVAVLPPPVHGQSLVNQQMLERLRQTGNRVRVVDTSPGSLVRSFGYHSRRLWRYAQAVGLLIALAGQRHKRLYTPVEAGNGMIYTLLLVLLARLTGYSIFLHHHTAAYSLRKRRTMAWLARGAGRRATHIALSATMRADLMRQYPGLGPVLVADNACHIDAPAAPERVPRQGPLRLGLLSNLTVEKGALDALKTAERAVECGLDVTLVLAGPVPDHRVAAAIDAARSSLGRRLELPGPLYGEAKYIFLQNLDVFLFPTRYTNEAQPLVLLEALSQGCVIIANDKGYIADMLGETNWLLDAGADFAEAAQPYLQQLVANGAHGHNGCAVSRTRFETIRAKAERQVKEIMLRLEKPRP